MHMITYAQIITETVCVCVYISINIYIYRDIIYIIYTYYAEINQPEITAKVIMNDCIRQSALNIFLWFAILKACSRFLS